MSCKPGTEKSKASMPPRTTVRKSREGRTGIKSRSPPPLGVEAMSDNASNRPRWFIAPYFIVDDVVTSANYYRDQLGFEYERFWGEPPRFCMVQRSGIVIMLSRLPSTGVLRPNRL